MASLETWGLMRALSVTQLLYAFLLFGEFFLANARTVTHKATPALHAQE